MFNVPKIFTVTDLYSPMLFEVILSLETFAANFTTKSQFGTFVRPFVYHQIIGLRKPPLAIFANKFTLWSHFSSKLSATNFVVNLHYSEHLELFYLLYFLNAYLNQCFRRKWFFIYLTKQRFSQQMLKRILFYTGIE